MVLRVHLLSNVGPPTYALLLFFLTGVAYLSNVAVLPSMRRQGVARSIVAAAERLAAAWGCRAVGRW